MKKHFFRISCISLISLFAFISFPSCNCKKAATKATTTTTTTPPPARDYAAEGYTKALVIANEIENCKFLIELEHVPGGPDVMQRLEPTNLKEEFKKDQLMVWVKYAAKKGAVSTCMVGPIIEITDIQLRN